MTGFLIESSFTVEVRKGRTHVEKISVFFVREVLGLAPPWQANSIPSGRRLVLRPCCSSLGDSKVHQLDLAIPTDEDVLWCHIPVMTPKASCLRRIGGVVGIAWAFGDTHDVGDENLIEVVATGCRWPQSASDPLSEIYSIAR